jgi:hypothetical protein
VSRKTLKGAGGAGAFSPLSLPGLVLWLDASSASSLFTTAAGSTASVSDGDPVGRWEDLSGGGRNVTQGTASRRPTLKLAVRGGRNVVRFDGVDDVLASSAAALLSNVSAFTVIAVLNLTGAALGDGQRFFGHNSPVENDLSFKFSPDVVGQVGKPSLRFASNATAAYGPASLSGGSGGHVLSAVYASGDQRLFDNGVEGTADTASISGFSSSATGFGVGAMANATSPFPGDVCELAVYSSALSDADRQAFESYANAKWSLF